MSVIFAFGCSYMIDVHNYFQGIIYNVLIFSPDVHIERRGEAWVQDLCASRLFLYYCMGACSDRIYTYRIYSNNLWSKEFNS